MIKTDIVIIGAGPVGLFTVFEAGLMGLRCHLIDALPYPGGQLKEIYPRKPIYDIPGMPSVLAGTLIDNLLEQAQPFKPGFTLGNKAISLEKKSGIFYVNTEDNIIHQSPVVIIAGGLGSFEPRRPVIENLKKYEEQGKVLYMVKDPDLFKDKSVIISGGGDSALDWCLHLANQVKSISLVHRSEAFRAHQDSVNQINILESQGKLKLYTSSEVKVIEGDSQMQIEIHNQKDNRKIQENVDYWLPLFGLTPKLGPLSDWGLEIENNAIKVDNTLDYSTNVSGVFAVGDINTYPGKLKLILSGFHEATLAVQSAYKIINPDSKFIMKYTTVQGIKGF